MENEKLNVGSVIVQYEVNPGITAENDEDGFTGLGYIQEAFREGRVTYRGYTYPEFPDRLSAIEDPEATTLLFTFNMAGITPFHAANDFTPVIVHALLQGDGEITGAQFYDDSVLLKRFEVALSSVLG